MKTIALTKGYVAFVNDEDYDKANAYTWHAQVCKRKDGTIKVVYGRRNITSGHKKSGQMLHRYILDIRDPGVQVDHEDRNGLNCQRLNLRIATPAQNSYNRIAQGLKGVSKVGKKWRARIEIKGKNVHIGYYKTEREAATAYNVEARKSFGKFAYLNIGL